MKRIAFNHNSKLLQDIVSVHAENNNTQQIIDNLYGRFSSDANSNHHIYAKSKLVNFRYIPKGYIIPSGGYIRLIDMRTPFDAKLYSGGFITSDNGYSVVVRAARSNAMITFDKQKYSIFLQLTMDDQLRAEISALES